MTWACGCRVHERQQGEEDVDGPAVDHTAAEVLRPHRDVDAAVGVCHDSTERWRLACQFQIQADQPREVGARTQPSRQDAVVEPVDVNAGRERDLRSGRIVGQGQARAPSGYMDLGWTHVEPPVDEPRAQHACSQAIAAREHLVDGDIQVGVEATQERGAQQILCARGRAPGRSTHLLQRRDPRGDHLRGDRKIVELQARRTEIHIQQWTRAAELQAPAPVQAALAHLQCELRHLVAARRHAHRALQRPVLPGRQGGTSEHVEGIQLLSRQIQNEVAAVAKREHHSACKREPSTSGIGLDRERHDACVASQIGQCAGRNRDLRRHIADYALQIKRHRLAWSSSDLRLLQFDFRDRAIRRPAHSYLAAQHTHLQRAAFQEISQAARRAGQLHLQDVGMGVDVVGHTQSAQQCPDVHAARGHGQRPRRHGTAQVEPGNSFERHTSEACRERRRQQVPVADAGAQPDIVELGAPEHDPMKAQANVGGGKIDALQQKRCIQQRLPRARRRARGLTVQRA